MADDDERFGLPDGHRYDAPEPDETRSSKEWVYAALAVLVLAINMVGDGIRDVAAPGGRN